MAMAKETRKRGGTVKIALTASQRRALKAIGADVRSISLRFPKRELRVPKVTCVLVRVPSGSRRTPGH